LTPNKYFGIVAYTQCTGLLIIILVSVFLFLNLSCTQYTKAENEEYPFDFGYGPYKRKIRYPISKGNLKISGSFNFNKLLGDLYITNNNAIGQTEISPSILFFATNGLAIGFDGLYYYHDEKDESHQEYSIIPKAYYFRTLSANIFPYISGGLGYTKGNARYRMTDWQYDVKVSGILINSGVGMTFLISSNKSISIEAGCITNWLTYQLTHDEYAFFDYTASGYNFYTKIGFDFFIPLTKTIIIN